MFFDWTYLVIVFPMVVIAMIAQIKVQSTYQKYSKVHARSSYTAEVAVRRILDSHGLHHIQITRVPGNLTDHYDPKNQVIALSESVYGSTSVAAIGVAAHECGHAIQHAEGYVPLKFRSAFVPVANFGSKLAWPVILLGLFINSESSQLIINAGIFLFSFSVLFQLITLPVEFDASKRAIALLEEQGILSSQELPYTRKVLGAAALTYVASAAAAILQLLRLIMLFGGRRRND